MGLYFLHSIAVTLVISVWKFARNIKVILMETLQENLNVYSEHMSQFFIFGISWYKCPYHSLIISNSHLFILLHLSCIYLPSIWSRPQELWDSCRRGRSCIRAGSNGASVCRNSRTKLHCACASLCFLCWPVSRAMWLSFVFRHGV